MMTWYIGVCVGGESIVESSGGSRNSERGVQPLAHEAPRVFHYVGRMDKKL